MTEVDDEMMMEDDDGEEGVDMVEYLGSLLQTEDGDSLATVVDKVAKQIETQNKILLKILSVLSSKVETK
jgi:hypothetical protein